MITSSRKVGSRREMKQNNFRQKMGRTFLICLLVLSPAFASADPLTDEISVTGGNNGELFSVLPLRK